ncbi:tyrosine-type recombinase/integrase [Ramlibacter sp. MAHUQ-53]|uniref:tyrosine-type recombinase/integrase n=1 Tax=unclassified Ramlibacter TaxID=2617605 RepID=UPI0036361AFD
MLSDTKVRKAEPAEKKYRLADERGLHLLVRPNGSKLWQLRYRHEGKERTASLGQYPDVSLKEARVRRDDARRTLATGVDPVQAKHTARAIRQAETINTFEAVAREWWGVWKSSRSDSHVQYVIRRLEQNVFPAIGARPVAQVEAPELVAMAKAVEARGALDIAKRCLQMCNQVFRYAIAHGKANRNPATDIRPSDILPARAKQNYARVDARELPMLLRKIDAYQGHTVTRLAIKLMALTFVRTGELIGARWAEFDLEAGRWDVPAERMKMRTPHIVPLSPQAIDVLRTLQTVTGGRELLFPGERDHGKPMSNNTILAALERMGYKGQMTGHGFRGLASTILHEHEFDHAHIELQLAHSERNAVSAAYNHALYLPQRAEMMAWWGNYLESVARGNVLPLRRLAA